MKIVESISELRESIDDLRGPGRRVGFVPTMGYLHNGHLELVRKSMEQCQATVASIFVNPTQFNDGEDFDKYPRDDHRDLDLLEDLGAVDVVFMPSVEDVYPPGSQITVEPGPMANALCGMSRPGHFRGVLTVVAKLFNMVKPDLAFFGAKDFQQFSLIARMVGDLNFDLGLRLVPTVREDDGLAMSSRNARLSPTHREEAPILFQAMEMGQRQIRDGETAPLAVMETMMSTILKNSTFDVDYLNIVDPTTLEDLDSVSPAQAYLIALAAYAGPVRLIDNLLHHPKSL